MISTKKLCHKEAPQNHKTHSPHLPQKANKTTLRHIQRAWITPWFSVTVACVFYISFALLMHWDSGFTTDHAYFNYLADALIHKQVNLRLIPPRTDDLLFFNDKIYLYWLPMPAIMLLPLVYIFGVGVSDLIFNIMLALLNVRLCYSLLKKFSKLLGPENPQNTSLLTIAFSIGSVFMTLVPVGGVWATSQIVTLTFIFLGYLYALDTKIQVKSALLAGLCFSAAVLTRSTTIFTIIFPLLYIINHIPTKTFSAIIKYTLAFTAPILVSLLLIAFYNCARFSSFTDFGLYYQKLHPSFVENVSKYGMFNIHYVPQNLFYQYINYPIRPNTNVLLGGSLFLLSPIFLSAFWAIKHKKRKLVTKLILTIVTTSIPLLLYMGTGFVQFGPRYALDFMVPFLLLCYIGIEYWPHRIKLLTTLISILHYSMGTYIVIHWAKTALACSE